MDIEFRISAELVQQLANYIAQNPTTGPVANAMTLLNGLGSLKQLPPEKPANNDEIAAAVKKKLNGGNPSADRRTDGD